MTTDAERWQWLATLKCNSFTLSRDDGHASNYMTAKEWIEECLPENFSDTDQSELQRMKDANTIWTLQVYPDTPVGSYQWHGATAQVCVDAGMDAFASGAARRYADTER